MKAEPISPFGVRITEVDIRRSDELHRIWELLWKHSVVILPSGAAQRNAPDIHEHSSLIQLGQSYGVLEECQAVARDENRRSTVDEARETDIPPEREPVFQSQGSWRVDPSVATIVCCRAELGRERESCFHSTNAMFRALPSDLKNKLHSLTFTHSRLARFEATKGKDDTGTDHVAYHPALIKHPQTGSPLLYANSGFTVSSPDLTQEESESLLAELFSLVYNPDDSLMHKWNKHDVVIWDTLGTQHTSTDPLSEPTVAGKYVVTNPGLRLERYAGERLSSKAAKDAVISLLVNPEEYSMQATRYEDIIFDCGYLCPSVATMMLAKHLDLDVHKNRGEKLVLDVAAGTGKNASLLMEKYEFRNVHAMDYTPNMLAEAKRRCLYQAYYVHDANTAFPFESDAYGAVICAGGFAPKQILPMPALSEMVRITQKGGYVVFTAQSGNKAYFEAAEKIVASGAAQMVEKKTFVGMAAFPDISHFAMALKVL